ncbi:UDP-N-acetylmuramate--L-alanine ligase [Candidatus Daviesbacteria bacterium]|nr:UDP-N-acetylmuramate--L-alanine ligase [Candidatus Daviesbacteria bacterium]
MVKKAVHFLGIGGSGTSSAAAIAEAQGFEVGGCDLQPNNEFTTIFQPNQLQVGHSPQHLASHLKGGNVDILAVTPAIFSLDPDNQKKKKEKKKGIEVLTWQQFVGKYLAKDKSVIAVCGTHGKTTTTAMIAQILEDAGLDPTVELGGIVPRWKANYRVGKGKYFVVEADEFNDNFLSHYPQITVVTNIEMDHPEYFKDFEAVKSSFKKFLLQTKTTIVTNLTDSTVAEILKGVMKESSVSALDFTKSRMDFNLKIPGQHNVLNAKAAMQVGLLLGTGPEIIRKSLNNYTGAGRRFEYIGEFNQAKIYSDFAHHPTEIKTTMEAAREKFPKERIFLVYQPHMFSRIKALFEDFVRVFQSLPVDQIFITDIYPSREKDTGLVNSKQLVDATAKDSVSYIGSIDETLEKLKPQIKPGNVVFFMGAGSIDQLARKLVKQKVLVFGLGLNQGGVGVAKFFAQNGAEVRITDLKTEKDLQASLDKLKEFKNISYTLGGHTFEDIDWADLIIKNPAVKPENKYIGYVLEKDKEVETDFSIFLQYADQKKIIAITGTKGKTTTASLIYEVLKAANEQAVLAGNIGRSILDTLPYLDKNPWIIVEISSFQLQALAEKNFAPKIAVITNIYPDHLNWHFSMEEYIEAKKIIAEYQTKEDFLFIRGGNVMVDKPDFLKGLKAKIIRFSKNDLPAGLQPNLLGEHNLENIAAAYSIGKVLSVNSNLLLKSLTQFKGVPFRIELIKEWYGVKIYNDTTATSPEAGIQAIKTLSKLHSHIGSGKLVLICGGMNKKMDYKKYAEEVIKNVQQVFFLEGDATEEIIKRIQNLEFRVQNGGIYNNIEKLLQDVKKEVKPGDTILFSPAATSFNLFQNEFDRGRQFNKAVEKVFGEDAS